MEQSMSDGKKISVLIVEDDKRLNYINRHALESEGYKARVAFTLTEARSVLAGFSPDVILLDVKLPDGSGFDFCREIREKTAAHIIFLTSVTGVDGELEGLTAGGNDYLRKPYSIDLLLKRVQNAALIKDKAEPPQTIKKGSLMFDLVASRAFMDGVDLLLTPREFSLLLFLAQNEAKAIRAEILYAKAWNAPLIGDKNTLQATVSKLRRKIEPSGYGITTLRGQGYAFGKI
jgi:DNA-binding response OmpR family regulator